MKKEKKEKKSKNKKKNKKNKNVNLSFSDICPIIDYDDFNDCFKKRFNDVTSYMDILEIKSLDGFSNSGTVTLMMEYTAWQTFYEKYLEDIKIISMHFPVDVKKQIEYIQKKYLEETNPQIKKGLKQKHSELETLNQNGSELNYFMFIFSNNVNDLLQKKANIISEFISNGSIQEISKEKKLEVLYKINNPVSMLS